ncbi:MAG: metalloprotease [Bacillota bacterium]|nr:metalloprotease [Bacillota bacterium]
MNVDIKPLKNYREPKYPDKYEVLANPKVRKTLPERWKSNAYVCAALSTLMVASLTSCAQKSQQTGTDGQGNKALVAPIFEHGQGRGSFGCDSVAPPSFLSEEEAFQVIQEEARQYGVSFHRDGLEIKGVGIPQTSLLPLEEGKENKIKVKKGNLQLDGYDAAKNVTFEFVSQEDFKDWAAEGSYSTVESYDLLSTAKALKDGLAEKNGNTSVGIFYDPMSGLSEEERKDLLQNQDWGGMSVRAKEMSKEDLKKQVKDFLEWLKAQGIM